MKKIPLTQGKFALVDDEDFEKFKQFKWFAQKDRSGKNFYAGRKLSRKLLLLHCEILGIKGVDHKSGDGLDCRRENLRPLTKGQNLRAFCRKAVGSTSKFRGVSWQTVARKWRAQVHTKGIKFYLGLFTDETEAALAYDVKAIELGFFKEALNFPVK